MEQLYCNFNKVAMKLNKKHRDMHEANAVEWDKLIEASNLTFELYPVQRTMGKARKHYPCGHHVNFASRVCHEKQRKELLQKGLI